MLVVLVYFIRGTVLPWYIHVPDFAWVDSITSMAETGCFDSRLYCEQKHRI